MDIAAWAWIMIGVVYVAVAVWHGVFLWAMSRMSPAQNKIGLLYVLVWAAIWPAIHLERK
jgi:hypothetical protein